ncbi:MAG: hypothetical protein WCI78_04265 [Mycobacterium sp.]
MKIPLGRVITRAWLSTAIAVGWCIAGSAPASADQDEGQVGSDPFAILSCDCPEPAPAGSAAESDQIRRGIHDGLTTVLPALPAAAGRPGR